MNPYQSRWIKLCSVAIALAFFLVMNLDRRAEKNPDHEGQQARFLRSLVLAPLVAIGGVLPGALLGSGIATWHWLRSTSGPSEVRAPGVGEIVLGVVVFAGFVIFFAA